MDQQAMALKSEMKNKLERELNDTLYDAAKREIITLAQIQTIAKEILPAFESVHDYPGLLMFLQEIVGKWSFFDTIFTRYKHQLNTFREQEVINKLTSYIHSMQ